MAKFFLKFVRHPDDIDFDTPASSLGAAAWHGGLNGSIAGPFTLGATVALLVGRLVAARMPALHLQRAFAGTCLAVAALLLARAAGWL